MLSVVLKCVINMCFCRSNEVTAETLLYLPETHPRANSIPRSSVRKREYNRDNNCEDESSSLCEVIQDKKKNKKDTENRYEKDPIALESAEETFFKSCALRMMKLPPTTRSYLLLQIAQLFFNAENPDVTPVPIINLPSKQTKPEQLEK